MELIHALEYLWQTYGTPDRLLMAIAIYNAFVQALPDPEAGDGKAYRFIYSAAHGLAFNFNLIRRGLQRPKPAGGAP